MSEAGQAMSPKLWARIAGLFYLVTFSVMAFGAYVARPALIVRDDAAATAANILAAEPVYRLGVLGDIIGIAAYAGVTAILYLLLSPISRPLATIAAFGSIAGIAVGAVSVVFHVAPLFLLSGADYLSAFTIGQVQALALLSLKLHGQIFTIGMIFFGAYCLLTGWLLIRAPYFPSFIGVVLAAGGAGYWVDVATTFVAPELSMRLYPYTYMAGFAGEALLSGWLLIVGLNSGKWSSPA